MIIDPLLGLTANYFQAFLTMIHRFLITVNHELTTMNDHSGLNSSPLRGHNRGHVALILLHRCFEDLLDDEGLTATVVQVVMVEKITSFYRKTSRLL